MKRLVLLLSPLNGVGVAIAGPLEDMSLFAGLAGRVGGLDFFPDLWDPFDVVDFSDGAGLPERDPARSNALCAGEKVVVGVPGWAGVPG
jgi:hypothetical protein